MNTTPEEGVALAQAICQRVGDLDTVDVVLCPPFPSLQSVGGVIHNTSVMLGAQNVSQHNVGAYTGEVSVNMLQGLVSHVIVGHSERRILFGETDEVVAAKASAVCEAGITAIVCVGEDAEERQRRRAERFVRRQIRAALQGIRDHDRVVVAYEPIWAIGTGSAASIGQIEYMIASIREEFVEMFGPDVSEAIRVLYGGSTNARNIVEIAQSSAIDGALVGGASLDPVEFSKMVTIMNASA